MMVFIRSNYNSAYFFLFTEKKSNKLFIAYTYCANKIIPIIFSQTRSICLTYQTTKHISMNLFKVGIKGNTLLQVVEHLAFKWQIFFQFGKFAGKIKFQRRPVAFLFTE